MKDKTVASCVLSFSGHKKIVTFPGHQSLLQKIYFVQNLNGQGFLNADVMKLKSHFIFTTQEVWRLGVGVIFVHFYTKDT